MLAFGKNLSGDRLAESWELSANRNGASTVANGPCQGIPLDSLTREEQLLLLGSHGESYPDFPLIIKLIDAKEPLSVQVHPSDMIAREDLNQRPKSELWHILSAEDGAFIYLGLKEALTSRSLEKAVLEKTILHHLNRIPVCPEETYFIPAGTIHALGGGITIAEIQENSDTTFRLYDYDRVGPDGKQRPLHIPQALDAADRRNTRKEDFLVSLEHGFIAPGLFKVESLSHHQGLNRVVGPQSFEALIFLDGSGEIQYQKNVYSFQKGDTYLMPAGMGEYILSGNIRCLAITI